MLPPVAPVVALLALAAAAAVIMTKLGRLQGYLMCDAQSASPPDRGIHRVRTAVIRAGYEDCKATRQEGAQEQVHHRGGTWETGAWRWASFSACSQASPCVSPLPSLEMCNAGQMPDVSRRGLMQLFSPGGGTPPVSPQSSGSASSAWWLLASSPSIEGGSPWNSSRPSLSPLSGAASALEVPERHFSWSRRNHNTE